MQAMIGGTGRRHERRLVNPLVVPRTLERCFTGLSVPNLGIRPAEAYRSPTEMLVDRADQLSLTVPEMTVLLGGLRALDANTGSSSHGVLTDKPGTLSNDFFLNLLDMDTQWQKAGMDGVYEGIDRQSGKVKFTATPVDLIFGSNSELRSVAEVYAYDNAKDRFVNDFVKAWTKVMNLDRIDM